MTSAARVAAVTTTADEILLSAEPSASPLLQPAEVAANQPEDAREIARPSIKLTGAGLAGPSLALQPAVTRGATGASLQLAASGPGPNETRARDLLAGLKRRAEALSAQRNTTLQAAQRLVGGTTVQAVEQKFAGATRTEATNVVNGLSRMQTLQTELAAELKRMDTEMVPGFVGRMRGDGYFAARVDMMTKAEVNLRRDTELYRLMGGTGRSVDVSFEQILQAMERLGAGTSAGTAAIERAPTEANAHFDQLMGRINALEQSANALGAGESPLGLPQIAGVTVPALKQLVEQQRATLGRDPMGAARESTIATILDQAERLVKVMGDARKQLTAEVPVAIRALQTSGLPTGWAANELSGLVNAANAIAEQTARRNVSDAVTELEGRFQQYRQRLASAVSLDGERRDTVPAALAEVEKSVQSTRQALGRRLGVEPSAIMSEQPTPDTIIAGARQQLGTMREALSQGDIAAATKARDTANAAVTQSRNLVQEAVASVTTHDQTVAAQRQRHASLQGVARDRGGVVESLEQTYAADLAQPSRDALERSVDSLGTVSERIDRAHQDFTRGGVLSASRALVSTSAELDAIARSLDAIVESQRGLQASDASNSQALNQLIGQLRAIQGNAADPRTRAQARQQVESVNQFVSQLQQALNARGRNPNELRGAIQQGVNAASSANAAIAADWQLHANASAAIDRVQSTLLANAIWRGRIGADWFLWQTQIASMRSQLAAGNYEGVMQQAQMTETLIIAAAVAAERAERAEREAQERAEREARERAEQERLEREAQRRREEERRSGTGLESGSHSGTGLPSSSRKSGTGL